MEFDRVRDSPRAEDQSVGLYDERKIGRAWRDAGYHLRLGSIRYRIPQPLPMSRTKYMLSLCMVHSSPNRAKPSGSSALKRRRYSAQ